MASRRLLALPVIVAALAIGGCGSEGIQVAESDPNYDGAELFNLNCSGCHSLAAAGANGSASDIGSRERRDGPNFNERGESVEDVLHAIRTGGFSSGPMPQNIVTGEDAQKVAEFVSEYAGRGGSE